MAERASSSSNSNSKGSNNKPTALTFRSVLPHEPLPVQNRGYIHLQGGLEPKPKHSDKDQAPKNKDKKKSEAEEGTSSPQDFYWSKKGLEEALHHTFSNAAADSTSDSSNNLPHGKDLESVTVLEDASTPPYTKVRLCYSSPLAALQVVQVVRTLKLTPQDLLSSNNHNQQPNQNGIDDMTNSTATTAWQFPARSLQVTLLTTQPFLSNDIAWNRSNPPKFRRLICRPGEPAEALQEERDSTRFVLISGLVSPTAVSAASTHSSSSWWDNPRNVCEAIRVQLREYDSSNLGIEVYVSNKKNDNKGGTHFCHVGMRSSEDARALVLGLQGKSLEWTLDWNTSVSRGSSSSSDANNNQNSAGMPSFGPIQSDKLFLDYAAVTKRSEAKATARESGETGDMKGEPSRSECTSTTKDVIVPGLVLVPDFVSPDEEEVLMAALTGPTAPWAPSQNNFSQTGAVKRRVQHYGYVFDYETANVLRDRAVPGADCPSVPGLPEALASTVTAKDDPATSNNFTQPTNGASSTNVESTMENFCERCVTEGRGWDALACIMERTRRNEFVIPDHESRDGVKSTTQQYSQLNQITVNLYEPGEGIGSHVDTPSAFADGLMSISLNTGIVMEFRKQDSEKQVKKKLVYLPARSLILMSGPARYEWEHHIVTRMTDTHDGKVIPRRLRVSLTLRTAIDLSGEAMPLMTTRSFPPVWGGGAAGKAPGSAGAQKDALVTPSMEREHVHAVYDAIATQWHHTRGKRGVLWPGATQFLTELPPGSIVADVGAGDGKYFPAIWEAGSYVIGTDISLPLLQKASHRGAADGGTSAEPESRKVSEHRHHLRKFPAVAVADCMNVPLRSKSCDAAICIAVMHHLSTRERRIRCIAELGRIVKVGGLINIQAWAMEQQKDSRRKFAGTDVFVPFNAQPKYLEEIAVEQHGGDSSGATRSTAEVLSKAFNTEYDKAKELVVFKRYCHLYRKGELEELVSEVESVAVHESGYESGNHFMILRVVA